MPNVIVSDAGPIFSLAVIEQFGLLEEFFDEIYIPQAVWEEIIALKDSQFYPLIPHPHYPSNTIHPTLQPVNHLRQLIRKVFHITVVEAGSGLLPFYIFHVECD